MISGWPTWLGTPSQVGLFVLVLLALLKWSLPWKKLHLDEGAQIRSELKARVDELKAECKACHKEVIDARTEAAEAVRKCREDCDKETSRLQQELLQRDRQRIQEQVSIITAIMNTVGDNPQLSTLLKTFESVQMAMRANVLQTQNGSVIPNGDDNAEGT